MNAFHDSDLVAELNGAEARGDLSVGDTFRINHATCGDTRRRGYITRTHRLDGSSGVVDLFFCHNCGQSGFRSVSHDLRSVLSPPPVTQRAEDIALPRDAKSLCRYADEAPEHIYDWGVKYDVSTEALWSPSMGRIIMPVYDPLSLKYLGYQARRDPSGSAHVPKYLTVSDRDNPLRTIIRPMLTVQSAAPVVVIVEDWVSAHQFKHQPGVYGAPLFGLNATAEHLLWIDRTMVEMCSTPPAYLIWLDNDVKKSFEVRDYLIRLARAIGRAAAVVDVSAEPKHIAPHRRQQVVNEHLPKGFPIP